MKTVCCAGLVAAALVLGHLRITAAEIARFRYLASVYADEQAVGLNLPEGVACGADGLVVVGDTGNDRLLGFTYRANAVGDRRVIKVPQLAAPSRIHLNSKGEIYALDGRQRRVVHLGAGGEFRDVLPIDAPPPPMTIVVKDFAIDSADNLYLLDVFSARVLALSPEGKFRRAVPLPRAVGFGTGLAVDSVGNLYVLDSITRRIFVTDTAEGAFVPLGGNLSESLATLPVSVTVSKGVIFVVESGGSIVAFGQDGSFLSRQLARGREEGFLEHPSQLCINDKDEAFIADRDNSRIQVFRLIR
jgi:sugar lactone lactonase YvrE